MADDQFEGDHPRLDRLAEAHVVGDQQVDPWHLDGTDHRVKLVVLDVDARAERRLDVADIRRRQAPQRTASRKALSWSGGSKPVGSGRATFSMIRVPGSNSQTTWISSPVRRPRRRPGRRGSERRRSRPGRRRERAGDDLVDDPVSGPDADELALLGGRGECPSPCRGSPPNPVLAADEPLVLTVYFAYRKGTD